MIATYDSQPGHTKLIQMAFVAYQQQNKLMGGSFRQEVLEPGCVYFGRQTQEAVSINSCLFPKHGVLAFSEASSRRVSEESTGGGPTMLSPGLTAVMASAAGGGVIHITTLLLPTEPSLEETEGRRSPGDGATERTKGRATRAKASSGRSPLAAVSGKKALQTCEKRSH